eukprot:GFYU01001157.1.p1 GENE.GFYU01001157.1~~GFYU01001157.1.p1  ORF type:complete len:822 (+),score=264.25 GFYU01001157.1:181-2466(+)
MRGPGGGNLEMTKLDINCSIYLATAFVEITAKFVNNTGSKGTCVLNLPTNEKTTVSTATMRVGKRLIETMVIASDEARDIQNEKKSNNALDDKEFEKYVPNCFSLPVKDVGKKDEVEVRVLYFEQLEFHDGSYVLSIPLKFQGGDMEERTKQKYNTSLSVGINAGTDEVEWGSASYPLRMEGKNGGTIGLMLDNNKEWPEKAFVMSYAVKTREILATCLTEPPKPGKKNKKSKDAEKGTFAFFVSPPGKSYWDQFTTYPRSIVFLLDRSGSMTGKPLEEAKMSLAMGLDQLKPQDTFNIIAYDHQQAFFSQHVAPVNPQSIGAAKNWLNQVHPGGTTDILTPINIAMSMLSRPVGVPAILLITDGAVRNEREICQFVHSQKSATRISTFGIGPYCNAFFLKMLAQIGRGFSDVALFSERIYQQMSNLLQMTESPILTDVSVGVQGLKSCDLYPFPIPDLFFGAPLLISGKYEGQFPSTVKLRGRLGNGVVFEKDVRVSPAGGMPVGRVFVKQQLDLLTAKAWLLNDEKIKQDVVDISMDEKMPCAHTTMVAYETTDEKKKKSSGGMGKGAVAALAVGGIVVVGAAAMHFGDLGASMGNVGVMDAMSNVSFDGVSDTLASAGGSLMNGLGEAGSAMGEGLGELGNALGGAFEAVSASDFGQAMGDFGASVGDAAVSAGGAIADGAGDAVQCCGGLCGDAFGDCGGLADSCDCCGDLGNSLGDICGGCGDTCGDMCSGVSDFLGSCECDAIGDCLKEIGSILK